MTSHYHLVVATPDTNLSKGMRQLNGVYTQQFNRRHGLVGHLFQGRFKAILVERDAYLLELARYLVLNPVRAGMVSDASAWPWSSYRRLVGLAAAPVRLETDWVLGQFGSERRSAQERYARFAAEGLGQASIWGVFATRYSWAAIALSSASPDQPDHWTGCGKSPARSADHSPGRSASTSAPTPTAAKPWPALSSPAFTPCKRSPTISACTIPLSAARCTR
jgi:hypothetical protein